MKTTTLPRHARTGVLAVGWRKARPGESGVQPIWPVLGAAEDDDAGDTGGEGGQGDGGDSDDDGEADADDKPDGADQLGDAGKRALDAQKARWRTERDRRKAVEQELATLRAAQKTKPKADDEGDGAPDVAEIRKQAQSEARAEALRDRTLDRLEAKAARKFADPEDARAFLAGRVEDFIDGDHVDNDAITDALDELLVKRPYLGSEQAAMQQKRFKDSGDGGARQGQSPKGQLAQDDLKGMSSAQIRKAKAEGRLNSILGVK